MYRIYLKRKTPSGTEVFDKTTTPSQAAAEAAFRDLIRRTEFEGQKVAAVLSLDNRHLMYHRFDREPGNTDYVDPSGVIKLHHEN